MPRDGSGTYSRAVTPPANGDVASATDFNSEMNDIATALTNSINTSGTKAFGANQPMGGFKLTGLGAGTSAGDSVRYEQISNLYGAGGTDVALADGGTGASLADPNADRIMFWDDSAGAVDWLAPGTGLAITGTTIATSGVALTANNGSDYVAATFRSNIGLGTIATQAASSVSITGGSITGITDLAVADGGTGASSASAARNNLGLVIGTDVQAYNAKLAALAASSGVSGTITVSTSSPSGGSDGDIWLKYTP